MNLVLSPATRAVRARASLFVLISKAPTLDEVIAATIIGGVITAQQSAAFQPSISRRALISNIATSSAAVILVPEIASAAERKAGKKELLRGGKNASDALHNGTDLNAKEGAVASGLLDKMGLTDIAPDNGPSSRAPPAPKKR
eukprot:scaffold4487_cov145-Skeletonema_menzelii.AAC.8